MSWLWALIIGGVAGWLAGAIMDSSRGGILFNIVLGILGSFVGVWLFGLLNIFPADNIWGVLLTSTVGAVVIIVIARLITGGKV
ncbi:MAG: GlsB/YeaQ/YmgE family stress response membrane protein [Fluviicola sp.]|uniref:Transglycosylase-associated protein n=1 Tax=Fluviicola taffensis (strain DSM 16823 / NCIMB 13979 / RW262) TaxID=755732 RepID=F2IFR8_FLUTR|nr:GlsB/YeaQ/YmgE family stress response membrane protein [Fluviicola taffensis]AEA42526.1 Transglycosylase-associated protein [Fluviicola taffensis DSM 16823]